MNTARRIKNAISIIQKRGLTTFWNCLLAKYSVARMPSHCISQPEFIQIEVTNFCNLRCAFCRAYIDQTELRTKAPKHLSLGEFNEIMSHFPHARYIRMNGIGEPLLNPDLTEMIQFASDRGICAHFFTNATLLDADISHRLLESGLDSIVFSIDGATTETFEAIRKGSKMNAVIENIKSFTQIVKDSGKPRPEINVVTTIAKNNVHEIPQIVELVHSIGIKNLYLKRMIPWVDDLQDDMVSREELHTIDKARVIANTLHMNLVVVKLLEPEKWGDHVKLDARSVDCYWPWTSTYITVDGWVTPCCNFFDPSEINFGNIFKEDFQSIWNSTEMRQFRSQLRNGLPGVCHQACSMDILND